MWLKVDDRFYRHPKVRHAARIVGGGKRGLGRIGALWLELATYAAEFSTDGFVPDDEIDDSDVEPQPRAVVTAMVEARLAHTMDGGIRLHDFCDYNPSAQQLTEKKRKDRDRKRVATESATKGHATPNGFRAESDATPDGILDDSAAIPERSRARSRPGPSRPVPDEEPKEPRGVGRATPARMTLDPLSLDEVRSHLTAAVHHLIESGAPFVDEFGEPDDAALLLELKDIAARDLNAEWQHSDELGRIVDGVIGERRRRRIA